MSLQSCEEEQRLFAERSREKHIDVGGLYHCSMRAGGGPAAARRFCDSHVTVEVGTAA